LPGSREPERHRFEFLPEVRDEANQLSEDLRRVIAGLVVELHANPWLGDLMDNRWPENLEGARKVRFDEPSWNGKPRYRLVYRNEPSDGAVSVMVVLAIGRRESMIAYAKASARLARKLAAEARGARRRPAE
jgi:hypothetical protein